MDTIRFPWRPRRREEATSRRGLLLYATVWLVAAAAVVGVVFVAFGGAGDRADTVSVPPLRETELGTAAGQSRCVLRRAEAGERLNPPVDGPAGGQAVKGGFYDRPVSAAQLTAAVRRGIIVIQFREGLSDQGMQALKHLQEAVPEGTVVAPNGTRMPYEIAVVAYRRLLGCPRLTAQAIDAVQLFRGRFIGSGPESSA
jgi:hypothetical protein